MSNFSLFQPMAIDFMKSGQTLVDGTEIEGIDWFKKAITEAFGGIAETYSAELAVSERRLEEAHLLWLKEIERMLIIGNGTPDHLKHAGFLAYWLRRRVVIERSQEDGRGGSGFYQDEFLNFTNEYCSFLVGFHLCLPFETERRAGSERERSLRQYRLNQEYLRDIAVLLHHKNVSPHALYLIYRSLFYNLRMDRSRGD